MWRLGLVGEDFCVGIIFCGEGGCCGGWGVW